MTNGGQDPLTYDCEEYLRLSLLTLPDATGWVEEGKEDVMPEDKAPGKTPDKAPPPTFCPACSRHFLFCDCFLPL